METLKMLKQQRVHQSSESGKAKTTNWCSIYIASSISFFGAANFSVFFSTLWPYLERIDKTATVQFFGIIVSSYSLGQCFAAPLLGYWSNRIRQTRIPLLLGFTFMLIGNLTFLIIELIPSNRKYVMLFGRLLSGIGSGNVSLLRTFASAASTYSDRSRAIAFVTGGAALGLTCGPAFLLFFTPLSYPGFELFGSFHLNMYTAPAVLACLMNVTAFSLVALWFFETNVGILNVSKKKADKIDIPPYDRFAVSVINATRFTQMFTSSNIETIGAPLSMMFFAWTNEEAVKYIALSKAIQGVISFSSYVAYIVFKLHMILKCRIGCIISLVVLVIFHLVTFSWWFLPGHVPMFSSKGSQNSSEPQVGCDTDKFLWCDSIRPVNVWVFYASLVLTTGVAFPVFNILLNTLLSRVVGPRRQGTIQGVMQTSGGVARMIGPITMSFLYMSFGPRIAWLMEIIVIFVNLLLWMIFYRRMVPLKMDESSLKNMKIAL